MDLWCIKLVLFLCITCAFFNLFVAILSPEFPLMAWAGTLNIQPHKKPKNSSGWFLKFTFEKQK